MIVATPLAILGAMRGTVERRARKRLSGTLSFGAGVTLGLAGIHDWVQDLHGDGPASLKDTLVYLVAAITLLALGSLIRSSKPSRRDSGSALIWALFGSGCAIASFAATMFLAGMFL